MAEAVKGGTVAERILSLLAIRHPVKESEMPVMLGLRPNAVRFEVKRLMARGLVVVEPVGDERYVALSGKGFTLVGKTSGDAARAREASRLPPAKPRDDDDPAFM